MRQAAQAASSDNDPAILQAVQLADQVLCGWGTHGTHQNAHEKIMAWLPQHTDLYCLGLTKDGLPKHPLYLRRDLRPKSFAKWPESR